MAAFDAALALVAQGHGGNGIVATVWRELVPQHVALLCVQPAAVLGMLTNAALHVQRQRGARVAQWQAIMAQLAPMIENARSRCRTLARSSSAAWGRSPPGAPDGALPAGRHCGSRWPARAAGAGCFGLPQAGIVACMKAACCLTPGGA